jgi:fatty acid-binding protein DegV
MNLNPPTRSMSRMKTIVNPVGRRLRLLGAARSFKGGLRRVLNLVERMGTLEDLAVVHTRSPEVAEKMADCLAERTRFPKARIWVRETGTVLATHAGPGVIGVLAVPIPRPN